MGIQFGQLLLSLTILIVLHEWGHFYFAKKFKTKVEKFYLFFDFLFPISTLLKFSLFKFKKGDTEYGIGWFPLGGYVQIAGMVDEQMDTEHLNKEPQPWEFRAKPKWQRLLIMFGGILVNIVVGILIFWMIKLFSGDETLPMSNVKYGIHADSIAIKIGLRSGDKVLSLDNVPAEDLNSLTANIILDQPKTIQVERNGQKMEFKITEDNISEMIAMKKAGGFVYPRIPNVVDTIYSMTPFKWFSMQKGDSIVEVDGKAAIFKDQLMGITKNRPRQMASVVFYRKGEKMTKRVMLDTNSRFGLATMLDRHLETKKVKYGFFSALGSAIGEAYEKMVMQAKNIRVLFTVKKAHEQLGGFYTMSKIYSQEWDWAAFWERTAVISLILAFMNFLPVPMLDGGYILFLLIEMITRRNIPEKFILYANYVGLVLIMGLMIYANTDFLRH